MGKIPSQDFSLRHIGVHGSDIEKMLQVIGVESVEQLMFETIPDDIKLSNDLKLPDAISEQEYLNHIWSVAAKNKVYRSYIGQGYYGTIVPSVIKRNILENPGWYTQYTPYQAEISQGRLEALLNFQTMVSDLTGMEIANASLLDEGTAAAEAMTMLFAQKNKRAKDDLANKYFVDEGVYKQTKDVMITRAAPFDIELVFGDWKKVDLNESYAGVLLQYPTANGSVEDYTQFVANCKEKGIYVAVAADLMSLALLTPPGEWGADVVVGNTQRFGVPMGYGGPHAAYFATSADFKRSIPGRIIGVSKDSRGKVALRMALQTREQHIKRERATSNICTAQALLAIMAGMYAVYHGPDGIKAIAKDIHLKTSKLNDALRAVSYKVQNDHFFDTLSVSLDSDQLNSIKAKAEDLKINFFYNDSGLVISLDESVDDKDLDDIAAVFGIDNISEAEASMKLGMNRSSEYFTHKVFNSYRSESAMMRYIKRLENKDLSLVHSMIPLGSCTMKLNAATQLIPLSWQGFGNIHPFVPTDQAAGYTQIFEELSNYLCEITGFSACSFQPNSGAQGEYAGLMCIRAYHQNRNDHERNIALIPSSAHGTNPASAVMAGMKVVVVKCDEDGNIDVEDLKAKAGQHADHLSSLLVTYPSTHGVFETEIKEICDIVHNHGGLVYMDGANMNAQVGYTSPALIGADVCHLNLHKTFSIPHGGGGPGMGPICVNEKLQDFLPGHVFVKTGGNTATSAVSSAPWGSASILLISHAYVKLLGREGVKRATEIAILNANYMMARLRDAFPVLYLGEKGHCAHEMILDLRQFKALGVSAEDVAKRLIDYGFHSPTLSFPVVGTIMIEPTESEDIDELDRFCDAMLSIKDEIDSIARGDADPKNNVLVNAPHTVDQLCADEWSFPYTRKKAAYPISYLEEGRKFWPCVTRVDNAYGDRNLICTCPPIEAYEMVD